MQESGATWDKIGSSTRRKITETWTLGDYRVKVVTYHDKIKKSYWSIISECQIEESGTSGYYMEKHRVYEDLNKLAGRVDVSRYSWPNMERAHNIAADSQKEVIAALLAARTVSA